MVLAEIYNRLAQRYFIREILDEALAAFVAEGGGEHSTFVEVEKFVTEWMMARAVPIIQTLSRKAKGKPIRVHLRW